MLEARGGDHPVGRTVSAEALEEEDLPAGTVRHGKKYRFQCNLSGGETNAEDRFQEAA
jgi:hypothetical protein